MFLNRETGEMVFSDGFRLFAGMSADRLGANAGDTVFLAGKHNVNGVPLTVECQLSDGMLCAVTLAVSEGNADRRRADLFQALQINDICPETRSCIRAAAQFGELTIAGEPYFGHTSARVEYAKRALR